MQQLGKQGLPSLQFLFHPYRCGLKSVGSRKGETFRICTDSVDGTSNLLSHRARPSIRRISIPAVAWADVRRCNPT